MIMKYSIDLNDLKTAVRKYNLLQDDGFVAKVNEYNCKAVKLMSFEQQ